MNDIRIKGLGKHLCPEGISVEDESRVYRVEELASVGLQMVGVELLKVEVTQIDEVVNYRWDDDIPKAKKKYKTKSKRSSSKDEEDLV